MSTAPGAPILVPDVKGAIDAAVTRRYVEKTSVTNRNNVAVPADDPHLFFSVAANSTYVFRAVLFATTAASVLPDIDLGFSFPAGSVASWSAIGLPVGGTSITSTPVALNAWSETGVSGASVQRGLVNGGNQMILVEGRVKIGGTAGTFRLQWSQDVATAENTSLQQGSYMQIEKVA